MLRTAALVAATLFAGGCSSGDLRTPPAPDPLDPPQTAVPAGPRDGGTVPPAPGDSGVSPPTDAPFVDGATGSPCPAPPRLSPTDLPRGYLPAVDVTLAGAVDGDSERFNFPGSPNQGVRMLYVNTEESGGPDRTDFGFATKLAVANMLRGAGRIQVAVREDAVPGRPDEDPYHRWLSLIFVDGELLQTRLVREGYSAYYTLFGCAPGQVHLALLYAEAEANAQDRGIWRPGHPRDYRSVLTEWIGNRTCRPNPFREPYCRP